MKKYAKPDVNVLTTVFEGYLLAGTPGGNNGGTSGSQLGNNAKQAPFDDPDYELEDAESDIIESKITMNN
jgi:hypothetical protein